MHCSHQHVATLCFNSAALYIVLLFFDTSNYSTENHQNVLAKYKVKCQLLGVPIVMDIGMEEAVAADAVAAATARPLAPEASRDVRSAVDQLHVRSAASSPSSSSLRLI